MAQEQIGVPWRDWGEAAFAEAQAQDKLILLDIGAVWCHWCHVMDTGIPGDPVHTGTYADPAVQERIAASYIPIKVDNDRSPEINARYNMGGWPSTVFLTPDGETLYGETYVPPARMIGLLDYLADLWENERDQITEQAQEAMAQRDQAESQWNASINIDPETVDSVLTSLEKSFDPLYGGFGSQPKFPHPAALQFALEQYARTGDSGLREILDKTLAGMADGGMYDRYAGGFFRYSTRRDWRVPHYEKMLEDNARLTAVYAQAAAILNEPRWLDVVHSAQDWLMTDLRDPKTGAFAGSQDADAEEEYYGQPLAVRATLPTPYIDRTIYLGWNALLVTALGERYKQTGEPEIREAATRLFLFLEEHFVSQQDSEDAKQNIALFHYSSGGSVQGSRGLLSDQVAFIQAALEMHELWTNDHFLFCAYKAAEYLLTSLMDTEKGGFFDLVPPPDAVGELARPKKDIMENAQAALALLQLFALKEETRYYAAAKKALAFFAGEYRPLGFHGAIYARAVDALMYAPLRVIIVGAADHPALWALQQAAWQLPVPGKAVEWREGGTERSYPAAPDGSPRAYLCAGQTCHLVTDPRDPLWKEIIQLSRSVI
jgi:uncharacterized protein YyaL (SSP411 family)